MTMDRGGGDDGVWVNGLGTNFVVSDSPDPDDLTISLWTSQCQVTEETELVTTSMLITVHVQHTCWWLEIETTSIKGKGLCNKGIWLCHFSIGFIKPFWGIFNRNQITLVPRTLVNGRDEVVFFSQESFTVHNLNLEDIFVVICQLFNNVLHIGVGCGCETEGA